MKYEDAQNYYLKIEPYVSIAPSRILEREGLLQQLASYFSYLFPSNVDPVEFFRDILQTIFVKKNYLGKFILDSELEDYTAKTEPQISTCEVCGKPKTGKLCTRHLSYGKYFAPNEIIFICQSCNYAFHLAEDKERERLVSLNTEYWSKLEVLLLTYQDERADIVSDAILEAVGNNKTKRRPSIDMLYKNPGFKEESDNNLDQFMINLAKKTQFWNGHLVSTITKMKLDDAKKKR